MVYEEDRKYDGGKYKLFCSISYSKHLNLNVQLLQFNLLFKILLFQNTEYIQDERWRKDGYSGVVTYAGSTVMPSVCWSCTLCQGTIVGQSWPWVHNQCVGIDQPSTLTLVKSAPPSSSTHSSCCSAEVFLQVGSSAGTWPTTRWSRSLPSHQILACNSPAIRLYTRNCVLATGHSDTALYLATKLPSLSCSSLRSLTSLSLHLLAMIRECPQDLSTGLKWEARQI